MSYSDIAFHWLHESHSISTSDDSLENVTWMYYNRENASKYADFFHLAVYNRSNILATANPFNYYAFDLLSEYCNLPFTSAAHLGLTTGLLLTNFINARLTAIKESKLQQSIEAMILRIIFVAASLVLTLAALPIVGIIMILLMCFRQGVHLFLKLTQPRYVGLFAGLDAIWALEEEATRSVINVLTILEVDDTEQGNNLLHKFRETIVERFATSPLPCPKLFHFRKQCLGYFYWECQTELKIEEYIRSLTVTNESLTVENTNINGISEETLKILVADVSNSKLPADHMACWEVLVGSQPVIKPSIFSATPDKLKVMEKCSYHPTHKFLQYPVLFRIHHSLGDGVALLHLLITALADVFSVTPGNDVTTPSIPTSMPMSARNFLSNFNAVEKTDSNKEATSRKVCLEFNTGRHHAQSPTCEVYSHKSKLSHEDLVISTNFPSNPQIKANTSVSHNEISIGIENVDGKTAEVQMDIEGNLHNSSSILPGQSGPFHDTSKYKDTKITTCSTGKSKQRPLLLTNRSISHYRKHPGSHFLITHYQSQYNNSGAPEQTISSTTHHPNPVTKNVLQESSLNSYPRPRSCNQFLNNNTNNFSEPCNSNFHTSLPAFNDYYEDPKTKLPLQSFPSTGNFTIKTIKSQWLFQNNLGSLTDLPFIDEVQEPFKGYSCEAATSSRMSLEEPQSLRHNAKTPVSVEQIKYKKSLLNSRISLGSQCMSSTKDVSFKSMQQDSLHLNDDQSDIKMLDCYDSESDSYSSIPDDFSKSTGKPAVGLNTSATLHYSKISSPSNSLENPIHVNMNTTFNCVQEQSCMVKPHFQLETRNRSTESRMEESTQVLRNKKLQQGNRNRSINEDIALDDKSSYSDSSFEEINCMTTATQTTLHSLSLNMNCCTSYVKDEIKVPEYKLNTTTHQSKQEKVYGFLYNKEMSECTTGTEKQEPNKTQASTKILNDLSTATIYPDHCNTYVKTINTKQPSNIKCNDVKNSIHDDSQNTKETETKVCNSENGRPNPINRLNVLNLKQYWNCMNAAESNNENEHLKTNTKLSSPSHSSLPNQFSQLLNHIQALYKRLSHFANTICSLALAPASLVLQAFLKNTDLNIIHGPPLSGNKVISWVSDQNGDLFKLVKRVKTQTNTRFTEVFLTALSASLETYFATHQLSYNQRIPEIINVVIPARMENVNKKCAIQLPITSPMVSRKSEIQVDEHSIPFDNKAEGMKSKAFPSTVTSEHDVSNKNGSHNINVKSGLSDNISDNVKALDSTTKQEFSRLGYDKHNNPKRVMNNRKKDTSNNDIHFSIPELKDVSNITLNNRFSVALLTLPISSTSIEALKKCKEKEFSPIKRLNEVQHYSEILRMSLDYQVNYWLLRVVCSHLPAMLLGAVVHSSQSTLVVSNIMGPVQLLGIAGHKLKDIMFWVPHRGTTGIGVTILSYMERLQVGIIADQTLISHKDDAQTILDETILELHKLDNATSLSGLSTQ